MLKHFLWKFTWNILPVRTNIFKFNHTIDPEQLACPLCLGPPESIQHIFLPCPFARSIWRHSSWPLNTTVFESHPIDSWTKALLRPHCMLGIPIKVVLEFQITALVSMDHIWMARNKLIHNGTPPDPQPSVKLNKSSINHHLSAWKKSPSLAEWSPPPQVSL